MGVEFEKPPAILKGPIRPGISSNRNRRDRRRSGEAMTDHLEARARRIGRGILPQETPACRLEIENSKVEGVCAVSADGKQGYHFLCKAALIATGSFGNNAEWVKEQFGLNLDQDFFGMRFPGHEGDGIQMAWNAGIKESDMIEMIFDIFQPGSSGSYTNDNQARLRQPEPDGQSTGPAVSSTRTGAGTTYTGNSARNQTGNTGFMILDEGDQAEP